MSASWAQNDNLPGGDPQARDMLISGEVEFYTLMGGILGEVVPIADIQGMPFAFRDAKQVYAALDGDLGDLLRDEARDQGHLCRAQRLFRNGFRQITSSTHPISHRHRSQGDEAPHPREPDVSTMS